MFHSIISKALHHRTFFVLNICVPIFFLLAVFYLTPMEQVFQFDTDEGIQLVKATLYHQGFALYTEIWNDQPSVHTILLAQWMNWFGESIKMARLLTLCFATILVWSFCQTVYLTVGFLPALISTLWLITSDNFLKLSTSVMIGLPALSLAMLSLYFLLRGKLQNSWLLTILSAFFFALAIQTKLFVVAIFPVYAWSLLKVRLKQQLIRDRTLNPTWEFLTTWLGGVIIFSGVLVIILPTPELQQLITSHLGGNTKEAFIWSVSYGRVVTMLLKDWPYSVLAFFAIYKLVQQRKLWINIPFIWFAIALFTMVNHRPIWYHHYLLLAIPITWLAAYSLKEFITEWKSGLRSPVKINLTLRNTDSQDSARILDGKKLISLRTLINIGKQLLGNNRLTAVLLIFALLFIPIRLNYFFHKAQSMAQASQPHQEIINVLTQHRAKTQWLLTDSAIYGFYAQINVLPELAVISTKRWRSGNLNPQSVKMLLLQYQPEQVLLTERFDEFLNSLDPDLNDRYQVIFKNDSGICYLRNDLYSLSFAEVEP